MALEYNLDFISDKSKKSNIKKAISSLEKAYYTSRETSSFFLDPFERSVIGDIARKNNIDLVFLGGNERAERQIFVAKPYYEPLNSEDYIRVLEFESLDIKHPDVLGALIHLGFDRERIGDIEVSDGRCEFVVLKEDGPFIKYNLSKIKNEGVSIDFKPSNELKVVEPAYIEKSGFVSSLRLDNIVSLLMSTSRSKVKEFINKSQVKVNYQTITDVAYKVEENSMISIRGVGRFIFDGVTGRSKKDNYHIEYRKLVWYMHF